MASIFPPVLPARIGDGAAPSNADIEAVMEHLRRDLGRRHETRPSGVPGFAERTIRTLAIGALTGMAPP